MLCMYFFRCFVIFGLRTFVIQIVCVSCIFRFDIFFTLNILSVSIELSSQCLLVYVQWFSLCGEQRNDFGRASLELAQVTLSRADLDTALHECVSFFQEPVSSLMQYAHEGKCGTALLLALCQHVYVCSIYVRNLLTYPAHCVLLYSRNI